MNGPNESREANAMLTVVVPAYNEEDAIAPALRGLLPLAAQHNWAVLVVNDGSIDRTGETAAAIPGVKTISHTVNRGYGAALKTGIINARTPWVALFDADGQHDPADLERLVEAAAGFDMIVGQRGRNSHQEWVRKPGKWLLSKAANFLTGRKIPDLNSGLRVIRRDIIRDLLHLMPDGFSFSTTSTVAFLNLGFDVGYLPIRTRKRVGKSQVKQLKHGSNTILLIIRLILLFNPLKVFLPACLFLFASGTAYEILYGILWSPRHVRLIPGAFFALVTAILVFFMGLLVDQISSLRKSLHFEKLMRARTGMPQPDMDTPGH
ncbi:MAG TPA: glycosyltransferase family 2 protein [Candidatus Aminicenantes bacterium]|nr:glycosyltransferase family 2 protein [Candidatus Aminicenantes bacterium]